MQVTLKHADRKQPIGPQVYAALREAIVRLRLKPGESLSEKDIASQMRVSRTPVRWALGQLSHEGLVEVYPQIGTYVAKLKVPEIMEALFLRDALECSAARLAATRMTPADIDTLRTIVEVHRAAQAANDLDAVSLHDEEFHRLIIEQSGFPRVWRFVRSARDHLMRLRNLTVPQLGTAARTVRFHQEIVEGLASRNPDQAERYMRAHQDSNFAYTQDLMRSIPDYFEGDIQQYLASPPPWSASAIAPQAPRTSTL